MDNFPRFLRRHCDIIPTMTKIPVNIKLFDPSLPLPEYQTSGAAGFDLYCRLDVTIDPGASVMLPTNVAVEIPAGYWLMLAVRSSLHKRGLMPVNGVGVIDTDYCGNEDEIRLLLHNYTDQSVTIKRGERLAQGILMPRLTADFTPVDHLCERNRGGFGTTGV